MKTKETNYAYLSGRIGASFEAITRHPLLVAKLNRAERAELSSYIIADIQEQDVAAEEYAESCAAAAALRASQRVGDRW